MKTDLDWRPYHLGGAQSRMREYFERDGVEFELCAEGGQYVIKRTERRDGEVIVTETARGRERDARTAWVMIGGRF